MAHRIRIWDLPTRLFHWLLVAAVVGLYVSAQLGGNAMDWHFRLGYGVLVLLLFRLIWGLVGGRWSRFSSFVSGPGRMLRYLRGQLPEHEVAGHNPLGALSVLALLAVTGLQVASGLAADDEIAHAGPLTAHIPADWVSWATWFHTAINKKLLLALVVLHVLAIVAYKVKRKVDLVRPMLTGDKWLPTPVPESQDGTPQRLGALVLVVALALGWWWVLGRL